MEQDVDKIVAEFKDKYSLSEFKADRAIIWAAFGVDYTTLALRNIKHSKSLPGLAKNKNIICILVTDTNEELRDIPLWLNVIKIGNIPALPRHSAYNNRFIKWAIPFLFPNIGASIYADSDLLFAGGKNKILEAFKIIEKELFVTTIHESRQGWRDEHKAIVRSNRAAFPAKLEDQKIFYEQVGMPADTLIYQNNFLGRVHGSVYDSLSLKVFEQVFNFSNRDQLALPYAVWKTNLRPAAFPTGELLFSNFNYKNYLNRRLCFLVENGAERPYVFKSLAPFLDRGLLSPFFRFWVNRTGRPEYWVCKL